MTELIAPPSASPTYRGASCFLWLVAILLAAVSLRADEVRLSADFSVHNGAIRPLHGINKCPLAPGGLFDVIKEQKELGIPFARLHDWGWPNPYVVDHHVVFPNPFADPTLLEKGTQAKVYDISGPDTGQVIVRVNGKDLYGKPQPRFNPWCNRYNMTCLWCGGGYDPKQVTTVEIENHPNQADRTPIAYMFTNAVEELKKAKYQGRKIQVGSILLDGEVITE